MAELRVLHRQVGDMLESQNGSWQQRQALLTSIEELRVAAMGPTEYITRLRYQVSSQSPTTTYVSGTDPDITPGASKHEHRDRS